MYKYNDKPPRAPETFGVAGHLEEKSQVFYNVLSSPRQIGRVADLVAARLKKSNVDLLRLRELITHTLYLSYRSLRSSGQWSIDEGIPAGEPLQIEIGLDHEKIAFSIGFSTKEKNWLKKTGLAERLTSAKTESGFEELLFELYRYSDLLVIKDFKKDARLELVSLLALPNTKVPDRQAPFLLDIEKSSKSEVAVSVFTELGDLDYHRLLAGEDPEKAKLPSIGELLAKRAAEEEQRAERIRSEREVEEQRKLKVGDKITEEVTRVKGDGESGSDQTRVTVSSDDAEIAKRNRIGDGETEGRKRSLLDRLFGKKDDEAEGAGASQIKDYSKYEREELEQFLNQKEEQLRLSQSRLSTLRKRMEELEDELSLTRKATNGAPSTAGSEASADEPNKEKNWGVQAAKKLIDRIVGKKESDPETEADASSAESASDQEKTAEVVIGEKESEAVNFGEFSNPDENVASATENEATKDENADVDLFSGDFSSQLETGGFELLLKRARHELPEIKKLIGDKRVHKWIDSLLLEMGREKEKINQFSKRLSAGLKKAEFDFKTKERSSEEEIKRLNELGRQRELQIEKNQEQLARMNETIERMKGVMRNSASDAQYKKRYAHIQKMYNSVKAENQDLIGKLQEFKKKVTNQQSGSGGVLDTKEAEAMKRENMLVRRQADELRKTNKQLIERIRVLDQKARAGGSTQQVETMTKRLDQAVRIANRQKRDLEAAKKQIGQVEAERLRLQREIGLLRSQLKSAGGDAPDGSDNAA